MRIYPIGYELYGARERIDELLQNEKTLLIDTRITPYSWRSDYRKYDLKKKYGDKYRWAGEYLGNEAKAQGLIKIVNPEVGIQGLVGYLNKGYDLVLLCRCPVHADCHVSTIVELLLQKIEVEVVYFNQPEQWVKKAKRSSLDEDAKELSQVFEQTAKGFWACGDKVTCHIPRKGDVSAVVREVHTLGANTVKLRMAVWAPLLKRYIVSDDPRDFSGESLRARVSVIPELGEREDSD